jgi:hypothetical protein
MTMTTIQKFRPTSALPERLHAAYDHTDVANELGELTWLSGAALDAYCAESAASSEDAVSGSDLLALSLWLRREAIAAFKAEPQAALWNAWVYRSDRPEDMACIGSADTRDAALDLLPRLPDGSIVGQVQHGLDGEVVNP